ncbi:flagellar hook-length control protein FliK [Virgibacillus oceani]|uniref:Flagellar hook-length control protein-like C-terminal domain-containing protein n=1 Tax=Virgibacillus oceani TaxID=1479511 RepID=A0A917H6F4_9BACI|nr:flagellar hook-length control protein FliK [Virgibacillus oceani]GGG69008.1 hypothetical protein GCM10011398_11200 [Virgibacillus oceani]
MNAIAMMFQQVNQPVNPNSLRSKQNSGDNAIFQGLLANAQQAPLAMGTNKIPLNEDELMSILKNIPKVKSELVDKLQESGELAGLFHSAPSMEEIVQNLEEVMQKLTIADGSSLTQTASAPMELNELINAAPKDNTALQQQFAALFQKAETALTHLANEQHVPKALSSLVVLLEQWTALEKANQNGSIHVLESSKGAEQIKLQGIWRELVQVFQKRNQFIQNQQYNTNAKVTSTDVAKWVQHALSRQPQFDKTTGQHATSFSSLPMSRIEQFVIYVNQSQNSVPADQQVMEQFQKVMKSSKFLAMNNGTTQLSIALRPENLGEMMVKLTQINGEMTVKIMVTTHAAKEMLESNMHQLKHMFSPQQVVVEKQDFNSQSAQSFQGKQQDDGWNDRGEGGQSQHTNDDNNNQANDDAETQFHDLLMNEEV